MSLVRSKSAPRALVVDDDSFYRELSSGALSDAGFTVVQASQCSEALEFAAGLQFDIAIVDMQMPGIGGIELIGQLRAEPANDHLPIVVITGNEDTGSIKHAYEAGATSFLAKPLNWPLFVHHVNFVLKAARAEVELRDAVRTAEFMSELKTRVVSVLVGEFQEPLRTAQSMAELLRREVYGPLGNRIYLEYAEDLHVALDNLNAIQLRMMNTGRVISGEILLREEAVPLKICVMEAVEAVRRKADRRGIEIALRNAIPDNAHIHCDRSLVSQSMKMIAESAVQSSPRNALVTLDARLEGDGGFAFMVEDDAPELPDGAVREIMSAGTAQRHENQHSTMSRIASLTISRVLAEAHQGRLALNSTAGEGTMVRLMLPASRVGLAAPAEGKVAAPAEGKVAAPAEGKVAAPAEGKVAAPAEGKVAAPAEGKVPAQDVGNVAVPVAGTPAMALPRA